MHHFYVERKNTDIENAASSYLLLNNRDISVGSSFLFKIVLIDRYHPGWSIDYNQKIRMASILFI